MPKEINLQQTKNSPRNFYGSVGTISGYLSLFV